MHLSQPIRLVVELRGQEQSVEDDESLNDILDGLNVLLMPRLHLGPAVSALFGGLAVPGTALLPHRGASNGISPWPRVVIVVLLLRHLRVVVWVLVFLVVILLILHLTLLLLEFEFLGQFGLLPVLFVESSGEVSELDGDHQVHDEVGSQQHD